MLGLAKKINRTDTSFPVLFSEYNVMDLFVVKIPNYLNPFPSEVFRAASEDGLTEISITVFEKAYCNEIINSSYLKEVKSLSNNFSKLENVKFSGNFMSFSYIIENEIHYCLTSTAVVNGKIILCELILNVYGGSFNKKNSEILEKISKSIHFFN